MTVSSMVAVGRLAGCASCARASAHGPKGDGYDGLESSCKQTVFQPVGGGSDGLGFRRVGFGSTASFATRRMGQLVADGLGVPTGWKPAVTASARSSRGRLQAARRCP